MCNCIQYWHHKICLKGALLSDTPSFKSPAFEEERVRLLVIFLTGVSGFLFLEFLHCCFGDRKSTALKTSATYTQTWYSSGRE